MIDNNVWFFVSGMLADMEIQSDIVSDATEGLLISPESPLIEPQYKTMQNLITALALIADDYDDSLNWFVHECDFGRKPKEAGCENNMKLIDSHDRLRWLIELDCGI